MCLYTHSIAVYWALLVHDIVFLSYFIWFCIWLMRKANLIFIPQYPFLFCLHMQSINVYWTLCVWNVFDFIGHGCSFRVFVIILLCNVVFQDLALLVFSVHVQMLICFSCLCVNAWVWDGVGGILPVSAKLLSRTAILFVLNLNLMPFEIVFWIP